MAEVRTQKFICAKLSAGKHFSATQGERPWRLEVEIQGVHSERPSASDRQGRRNGTASLRVFFQSDSIYFSALAAHSCHMEV